MIELELVFTLGDKVNLLLNDEEYDEIIDWLLEHPNENELVPFDIHDGTNVITFRPRDVKYMIKYM